MNMQWHICELCGGEHEEELFYENLCDDCAKELDIEIEGVNA